jgi:hypothetical protein
LILREFSAQGIAECHGLLDAARAGDDVSDEIASLLIDETLSNDTNLRLKGIPKAVDTRFDLALWLNRQLEPILVDGDGGSVGVWAWLTLLLFDVVAPSRAGGTRKIGDRSLYILEPDNWRRYYRHLLAGPCRVMRAHWEELHITRALLAGKPNVPGELYEQIASRQEVITSAALVRLTHRLYWDSAVNGLKRGAAGKGAGSARRLAAVLLQLDLTWDLNEMDEEAIGKLLPQREFARFVSRL